MIRKNLSIEEVAEYFEINVYKRVVEYFGLSHNTIHTHLEFSLKKHNPEIYKLVKNRKRI